MRLRFTPTPQHDDLRSAGVCSEAGIGGAAGGGAGARAAAREPGPLERGRRGALGGQPLRIPLQHGFVAPTRTVGL